MYRRAHTRRHVSAWRACAHRTREKRVVGRYLAIGEKEADALHADLQDAALIGDQVLNRKLTAKLDVHIGAPTAGYGLLHRVFYTVIQVFALQRMYRSVYHRSRSHSWSLGSWIRGTRPPLCRISRPAPAHSLARAIVNFLPVTTRIHALLIIHC
jgi:hypothetical protein